MAETTTGAKRYGATGVTFTINGQPFRPAAGFPYTVDPEREFPDHVWAKAAAKRKALTNG